MPVRSRGSLLAGTAALAGLLAAGLGCHSSYSEHDSFSIPKTPAPANGGILSRRDNPAQPTAYPAQPANNYGLAPLPTPAQRSATLQPVPIAQVSFRRSEVIASTWSPVQRVSAEQPAPGPDLQASAPTISTITPPARLPLGTPMSNGNAPLLDGGDAVPPGSIVLPQPRPLGAPVPVAMGTGGFMPPAHPPHADVPREFEKMALPPYVAEPPDILLIQASNRITLPLQPIAGQHLIGPDGTVNLGIYGKLRVVGMTLEQIADAVAARLLQLIPGLLKDVPEFDKEGNVKKDGKKGIYLDEFRGMFSSVELIKKELQVDVMVYNSKFYYVITDGGGYGQQVYPIPIRGNETVLDALANVNGLPAVANKRKVWVARATRAGQEPKILPVDWVAVTRCGSSATNYQLFPGDRVYVDSHGLIKADAFLSRLYSPVLRTFGITLLGASTVNTIKNGGSGLGLGAAGLIR